MTSPSTGAEFAELSSVKINGNDSDADGSISKVGLYLGLQLLVEDDLALLMLRLDNVAAGGYRHTVRAYDNVGAVGGSAPVDFRVGATCGGDTTPPQVGITSTSNNAQFTEGTSIRLDVSASDIRNVECYVEGTLIGDDNLAPFAIDLPALGKGSFQRVAAGYDLAGNRAASGDVSISITASGSAGNGGGGDPPGGLVQPPYAVLTKRVGALLQIEVAGGEANDKLRIESSGDLQSWKVVYTQVKGDGNVR